MIIKQLNGHTAKMPVKHVDKSPDDERLFNKDELALTEGVDSYMRGFFDIEDVLNDPQLKEAQAQAEMMAAAFEGRKENNIPGRSFIAEALSEVDNAHMPDESEVENISEITAGWVDEWQSRSSTEKPEKEIREFISGSIEPGISKPSERSPKPVRKANLRMVSAFLTLSAAAVAGIFLVIRGLSPADPDKLFASSYKPFNVISTTVRGDDQKPRTDYDSAIEKYKDGDYEGAASLFASISMRDTSLISSRFFLGLAETARGNYTGAVTQLSAIASRPGDYKKDALWYLGLAYLKLSDTKEASACFSSLAQSPGFYHGKAERILRRLR